MPLTDDIPMISIDDHVHEPPDTWTSRVPERFRDSCPRVVELNEDIDTTGHGQPIHYRKGTEVWAYEDAQTPIIGMVTLGPPIEERGMDPVRFDEMRPGVWDPVARLADMDEDGVWAQTPFPSFPGFGGNRFVFARDKELAFACVQAYNDFILDQWCPGRQIGTSGSSSCRSGIPSSA
jgi:hypothetical protein